MDDKVWNQKEGRPSTDESKRRTSAFLTLIASGLDAEAAARQAKIGPWRALRIVTESSFNEIVQAIRAGEIAVAVVRTADTDPHQVAA